MAMRNYQWLGQMLAALGVVISLMLVAYELKQSRDVAKAELTLMVTRAEIEPYLVSYDADAVSSAWKKLDAGEELTELEASNWRRSAIFAWSNLRDRYMLWELGLLSRGELSAALADVKQTWLKYEEYRSIFRPQVWLVPESYKEYVISAREAWQTELDAND